MRKYGDENLREHVARMRTSLAAELLRESKLSVKEVANMVGFGSTAAFSRFFSRKTGVSLSAFRNQESTNSRWSRKGHICRITSGTELVRAVTVLWP